MSKRKESTSPGGEKKEGKFHKSFKTVQESDDYWSSLLVRVEVENEELKKKIKELHESLSASRNELKNYKEKKRKSMREVQINFKESQHSLAKLNTKLSQFRASSEKREQEFISITRENTNLRVYNERAMKKIAEYEKLFSKTIGRTIIENDSTVPLPKPINTKRELKISTGKRKLKKKKKRKKKSPARKPSQRVGEQLPVKHTSKMDVLKLPRKNTPLHLDDLIERSEQEVATPTEEVETPMVLKSMISNEFGEDTPTENVAETPMILKEMMDFVDAKKFGESPAVTPNEINNMLGNDTPKESTATPIAINEMLVVGLPNTPSEIPSPSLSPVVDLDEKKVDEEPLSVLDKMLGDEVDVPDTPFVLENLVNNGFRSVESPGVTPDVLRSETPTVLMDMFGGNSTPEIKPLETPAAIDEIILKRFPRSVIDTFKVDEVNSTPLMIDDMLGDENEDDDDIESPMEESGADDVMARLGIDLGAMKVEPHEEEEMGSDSVKAILKRIGTPLVLDELIENSEMSPNPEDENDTSVNDIIASLKGSYTPVAIEDMIGETDSPMVLSPTEVEKEVEPGK